MQEELVLWVPEEFPSRRSGVPTNDAFHILEAWKVLPMGCAGGYVAGARVNSLEAGKGGNGGEAAQLTCNWAVTSQK